MRFRERFNDVKDRHERKCFQLPQVILLLSNRNSFKFVNAFKQIASFSESILLPFKRSVCRFGLLSRPSIDEILWTAWNVLNAFIFKCIDMEGKDNAR